MVDFVAWMVCAALAVVSLMVLLVNRKKRNTRRFYESPIDEARYQLKHKQYTAKTASFDELQRMISADVAALITLSSDSQTPEILARLRNTAIHIQVIKMLAGDNTRQRSEQLQLIARIVGPQLSSFSKIRDDFVGAERNSQCWAVQKYIEHIVEDLSAHIFGF